MRENVVYGSNIDFSAGGMIEWFKSLFAWRDVRDSSVWLYQENNVTGQRRAIRIGGCYQPINHSWLDRIDYRPTTPPPSCYD